VADPSTVTVRIECASTSDLNVQDVSTTSSSSNDEEDDDELKQLRKKQTLSERLYHQTSSTANRHQTSVLGLPNAKKSVHQKRPSRLSTDANSMRAALNRPITAISLPSKPSTYDNDWDIDIEPNLSSTIQRRNPSCPSISPTTVRSKSSSQSPILPAFTPQQAPPVFTTTTECLGNNDAFNYLFKESSFLFFLLGTDYRPQLRRETSRRSQSLVKQTVSAPDSASPTVPLVFLTDDILLGSIRALQNERQLCKLSVEYLIDASNMRPDELARKANVGAPLPCQCGHTHSRCTLTLEFDQAFLSSSVSPTPTDSNHLSSSKIRELSRTQLGQLFSAVNRFIYKAQQESKRILIYGFELTPNSPLAVIAIQYVMLTEEQLTLTEAIQSVHRLFPIVPIKHQQFPTMDKRFQDYLKQLDRKTTTKNIFLNNNSNNNNNNNNNSSGDGASTSSGGNDHQRFSKDIALDLTGLASNTQQKSITSWTTIPMPIVNDNFNQLFTARSAWDK